MQGEGDTADDRKNVMPTIGRLCPGNGMLRRHYTHPKIARINSMDFLNFVIAVHHHRRGVDIPELDYPKLATLDGAVVYLKTKMATKRPTGRP